jgi:hypothetical protein
MNIGRRKNGDIVAKCHICAKVIAIRPGPSDMVRLSNKFIEEGWKAHNNVIYCKKHAKDALEFFSDRTISGLEESNTKAAMRNEEAIN